MAVITPSRAKAGGAGQGQMAAGETWPQVLKYNSEHFGARYKAMRYKHFGIWLSFSWKDYFLKVKYLALGLLSLGFKPGDKLLIIGDSAPEWYFAELAAQSNHGISVGLYSDLTPSEIENLAVGSEASFAMVEDQEQVDKLIEVRKRLPLLRQIIYWKNKGLANYKDPGLLGLEEVLEQGREFEKSRPGLFEENVASGKADEICALVYTSGASGDEQKAALHSFSSLRAGAQYHLLLDRWTPKDNLISYFPPAWITEQWLSLGCHLLSGSVVNFSEGAETQQQDIREIGPSVVFFNARLWEKQAGAVRARIQAADFLKKSIYRLCMPIGYRMADYKFSQRRPGLQWRLLRGIADLLVFRPIRDSLGLPHARILYTAGATLSPEVIRFYHALNLPLKNIYGTTEAGPVTGSRNQDIRLDTVGIPQRGTEIRISAASEILVKQPGSFVGYYKNPGATAQICKDGWVRTGDLGRLREDGHLIFIDRASDVVKLVSGETLAPQEIESRLKASPYIKDAWVSAGPERSYVSAVIIVEYNAVSHWADKKKVTFTTFSDLSQKPEVYELIRQEILRTNSSLTPGVQVTKFVNLSKEFDADEFELTRNRKLRRRFLEERYAGLVQAIYSGQREMTLESRVRYGDGRVGVLKTPVQIADLKEARA